MVVVVRVKILSRGWHANVGYPPLAHQHPVCENAQNVPISNQCYSGLVTLFSHSPPLLEAT